MASNKFRLKLETVFSYTFLQVNGKRSSGGQLRGPVLLRREVFLLGHEGVLGVQRFRRSGSAPTPGIRVVERRERPGPASGKNDGGFRERRRA